jgi:hypothetical protein
MGKEIFGMLGIDELVALAKTYLSNAPSGEGKRRKYFRNVIWARVLEEVKMDFCLMCGYDEHRAALEYHHVKPEEKGGSVNFGGNVTVNALLELSKCICVCANCHRIIHFNMREQKKETENELP